MLEPGNILEAKAVVIALRQQSTLPPELQLKLYAIGTKLTTDSNYSDRAIRDCINLFADYPQIQADYHTAELKLQADAGERGKGLPPTPIDPLTESSGAVTNIVRDICLSVFEDNHIDKLAEIAKSCDRQITDKSSADLPRSMSHGKWMGGYVFEFWTLPQSLQNKDHNLQKIVEHHPHTIVWLFPAAKLDEIDREIIPNTYQDWMRLLHYRHKIFYAYYQSRSIEQKLKQANTIIREIADRLKSQNTSLQHLQSLLFDTLAEFQSYSENVQALSDQQYTIETNRENYRSRYEVMTGENAGCDLQFLLEFETKYSNKYQRQITADRAHLDSGLQILENLSQTIQGITQIEQTKSDRTTNLLIAAVGSGLAVSQVVFSIVLTQQPPAKNEDLYQTAAFQASLIYGLISIGLVVGVSLVWRKLRK